MQLHFHTADVFTDRTFGGNPVAVVRDGSGLDAATMQRVAREMNLSETVFVLPPRLPEHTRRLRIFTPAAEVPFAGHPTLGTAFVLASIGEIPLEGDTTRIVFEEGVGPVPVTIEAQGHRPVRTQLTAAKPPELGPPPPPAEAVADCISLEPEALVEAPRSASCGLPFLFVAVRDRAALARARVIHAEWQRWLAESWAPQLYLYTDDTGEARVDLRARMFAPAHGFEDPATGSAVAALAGILAGREPDLDASLRWTIAQGVEMGRPSLLELRCEKRAGEVVETRVAGAAVMVSEGRMEIPDPGT